MPLDLTYTSLIGLLVIHEFWIAFNRGLLPALTILFGLTIAIITLLVRHIRLEDDVDGDW